MNRNIVVSAVQLPTVVDGSSFSEKQENNLKQILEMLTIAGERSSDLVLFGEYVNLHHRTWSRDVSEYVPDPIPGDFTQRIFALAKKYNMNIALPMFGRYRKELSSHVVLINRNGTILGCYQKAHPTIDEQKLGIREGRDLPVFKFDSFTVGIMTCMDIEYPEVAQVLMLKGADILLFPHVQGSWGEIDWEIRYRARAIDTGLYVVSASYGYPAGEWLPGKMTGRSSIVNRDGLILADMGRAIGVLTVELDLGEKRLTEFFFSEKLDRTLAVIGSRRPELYGELGVQKHKKVALREIQKLRQGKKK